MPVFAICNASRSVRKTVIANDLKELIDKGSTKLGIEAKKAALEKNGAEIEDDEVLLHLKDDLVMLMGSFDIWASVPKENTPLDGGLSPIQDLIQTLPTSSIGEVPDVPQQVPGEQITVSAPETFTSLPLLQSSTFQDPSPELPPSMKNQMITLNTPLPRFSDYVHAHLSRGESSLVWHAMIREAAQYYSTHYPDMGKSSNLDYQTVGQKMFKNWPDIARIGVKPWSVYASDLSSRIRYLRWMNKRKSLGTNVATPQPKAARLSVSERPLPLHSPQRKIPPAEYDEHCKEIARLFKKFQNAANKEAEVRIAKEVVVMLKETFANRREWIEQLEDRCAVKPIIKAFPCFVNPIFVYAELKIMKGKEEAEKIRDRVEKIFSAGSLMIPENQRRTGVAGDVQVFQFLEKETAFDRGKGLKTQSILIHKEVDSPSEADTYMNNIKSAESPSLILITQKETGDIIAVLIPADNCVLNGFNNKGLPVAVLSLLSVYYFAWISYPRIYSQILGFFQQFAFEEPFLETKSRKYIQFVNKFKKVL